MPLRSGFLASGPWGGPERSTSVAELLRLGEQFAGDALAARTDGLGPEDLAVLADQNRRAVGDALVLEHQAVRTRHRPFGVEVGEERERDAVERLGPRLVAELGIHGDTQHLGISGLELREKRVEAGDLDASGGREIQRIRDEQHVLLARRP